MKVPVQMLLLTLLLSSCSGAPYIEDTTPALNSRVKAGDTLMVNKEIIIPPYTTALKFQFTQPIGNAGLIMDSRKFEAVCSINIKARQFKPYVITPQEIRISKVEPFEVAGDLYEKEVGIILYLSSDELPALDRIECRNQTEALNESGFTTGLFKQSFGDYLTINRK